MQVLKAKYRSILLTSFAALTLAVTSVCFAQSRTASEKPNSLERIIKSGKIDVGVKYDTPPYGYVPQGSTEPVGFEIDLVKEIAKRLGVKPVFEPATSKSRVLLLESGKIDLIAASMYHTMKRDEAIDFTVPHFKDYNRLLVLGDSDIDGVENLAGKTVSVTQGSTQEGDIKRVQPAVKTLSYQTWPDTLQALLRGEAVAVVASTGILHGLSERANKAGKHVKIVGDGFAPGYVAMGVREGESDLRDAVNFALMKMYLDGTYEKISKKWWDGVVDKTYVIETWP